ncbi:MAG: carboxypeptidase-like regulatory domain-containing protein, partial [Gemmatimonadaceae bacterium]
MTASIPDLRPRRRWLVAGEFARAALGRAALAPAALVLMLAFISGALSAQPVRGTLTDSTRLVPVAGVVVSLLDGNGASVARTLSNDRGMYYFATRGTASSLRVQRIGYRAQTLKLPGAVNDITTLNIVMAKLPTLLAPLQVVDNGCPRRADEGSAIALLEQARTGLLATVVARKEMPSTQTLIRFEREMDGGGSRIIRQSVHVDSASVKTSSFESAHSATDFVTRGFTESVEGETIFNAPDAEVLLNDDFVAAYCFQLAKPERSRVNQVGLAFHAVRSARNRVDVEGALWIDTVARAIREIEFQYKGLATPIEQLKPGGTIGFREMTSGVVLIDRWTLRLVGVESDTVRSSGGIRMYGGKGTGEPPSITIRNRFRITETGGELARAVWPDGFTWDAPLSTLTVHASTAKQLPTAGTMLRLAHTNYEGVTDSAGMLRVSKLIPGPYQLVIVDPR